MSTAAFLLAYTIGANFETFPQSA
ncbi:hypothetical protein DSM3645_10247 [Blastopirellula marina DSM 3645]|uniref:Uncharacterized protein n=1 Tax=Blastopirellula marina DSM 3645 TaxID=314230 RepID=A3ZLZ0_9BACT|nr:hypothetical protein DSM3645_10247 [Blastopirellula marina DSM 3645]